MTQIYLHDFIPIDELKSNTEKCAKNYIQSKRSLNFLYRHNKYIEIKKIIE